LVCEVSNRQGISVSENGQSGYKQTERTYPQTTGIPTKNQSWDKITRKDWSTNSSRFKILFVAPGYKAVLLDLINYTSCFPRQSMGTLQRDIFLT
jgi:hypothetical protein